VRAPSDGVTSNLPVPINKVELRWRFQVFNVKSTAKRKVTPQRSYTTAEFKKRTDRLSESVSKGIIPNTLKISGKDTFDTGSIAELDTISTWLLDNATDIFQSLIENE